MTKTPRPEPTVRPSSTVERAMDVLMLLAASSEPDMGVTEIAKEVSVSKAVVYRMLTALRAKDLVTVDERTRRYSLGVGAMHLGLAYMNKIDIRQTARPELEKLSALTNETATLSVRTGWQRVYVDQVVPNRDVIMSISIGEGFPLHAGASSKAFLANMPAEEIDQYLDSHHLESLTSDTVTDVDDLRTELAEIREQGWSRSSAERQGGAASVAAPVLDHVGAPAAVISVCGPLNRFSEEFEFCRDSLLDSTRRLSTLIGWKPS